MTALVSAMAQAPLTVSITSYTRPQYATSRDGAVACTAAGGNVSFDWQYTYHWYATDTTNYSYYMDPFVDCDLHYNNIWNLNPGKYFVDVWDLGQANHASDTITLVAIHSPTGMEPTKAARSVAIHSGAGYVSVSMPDLGELLIVDLQGRVVYYNPSAQDITRQLEPGVYLLRIGGSAVNRIVIY